MSEPAHCHPRAFHLMEEAVASIETTGGLVRAAGAIAAHLQPMLRVEELERTIAAYAGSVATRVPRIAAGPRPIPEDDIEILLAHLHFVLFEQAGFIGNTAAYDDPRNSLLHEVLARRLGIPISLCLVYKAVGELLGLRIHGINAPLHFVVEVEGPARRTFIDAFCGGRLLWEDELVAGIARATGHPPGEIELERADNRAWIARMLRNLEASFANAGERSQVLAMQELATAAGVRV
ncbi:MAG: transglutaminase family protein [Planctomycetota bacterium]|jgi:regulator of sirC expression with transglutaminase-like and TPR domain